MLHKQIKTNTSRDIQSSNPQDSEPEEVSGEGRFLSLSKSNNNANDVSRQTFQD